jgi:hypothetical protein
MGHVNLPFRGRRLRASGALVVVAAFAALAASAQAATTQSGTTLSSTQSITFEGQVEPDMLFGVENPGGRLFCGLAPCETVVFSVAETGNATFTLISDDPNNLLDVTIECGMLVEMFRIAGGTDPVDGELVLVFPVVAGESCTAYISVFLAVDVFAEVPFHGTITLMVVPTVEPEPEPAHVSGGGQAEPVYSPFTTNAKPNGNGTAQGTVRYFKGDCKFHASIIDSVVMTGPNSATITGRGRLKMGNGPWSAEDNGFVAHVIDNGQGANSTGPDAFRINQCGDNPDGPISNGNITVRPANS